MARGQVHRSLEPPEFQNSISGANVRVEAIPKAFLGVLQPSLQVQRSASARPCHVTSLSISTCSLFAALETEAFVCMHAWRADMLFVTPGPALPSRHAPIGAGNKEHLLIFVDAASSTFRTSHKYGLCSAFPVHSLLRRMSCYLSWISATKNKGTTYKPSAPSSVACPSQIVLNHYECWPIIPLCVLVSRSYL